MRFSSYGFTDTLYLLAVTLMFIFSFILFLDSSRIQFMFMCYFLFVIFLELFSIRKNIERRNQK